MKAGRITTSIFLNTLLLFVFATTVVAQDYLALQGSATGTGGGTGNIVVEIWDAATAGNLLYNSSNDFNGVISSSRYDILLGNGSQPLSLNFSGTYYMEMYINGRDIDFNSSERQVFQSPVGNITVNDPIKTASTSTYALNVNDRFNVSGASGDATIGGVVNISGATTLSGVTTVANFFNITPATSAVRTNGTVSILSGDTDDALNISSGAVNLGTRGTQAGALTSFSTSSPAFTINAGFNISGASSDLSTNGSVTISSGQGLRAANQVAISLGGATTAAPIITMAVDTNNILNITGSVMFNKFLNITPATSAVRTNGSLTIHNADTDDALNITGGVIVNSLNTVNALFRVGTFGFQITEGGAITTQSALNPGGNIVVRSLEAQALSINAGFNVSGTNSNLVTNGTVAVQSRDSPALSVQGFNVSGADAAVRTNGSLTIISTDDDDAINTTGGIFVGQGNPGAQFGIGSLSITDQGVITTDASIGPAAGRGNLVIRSLSVQALSINAGFNVSGPTLAMQTNGTVTIQSRDSPALSIQGFNVSGANAAMRTNGTVTLITTDQDDAINVSGGGVRMGDSIDFVYVSLVSNSPLFSVKNNFNISPAGGVTMGSLGGVKIESTDADDALNVTGSIVQRGAVITIGNAESSTQHHLDVFDGGTNKCGYLRLFDDTGQDWFLFANSTGQLRMFSDAPTGAGQCNTGGNSVGSQP